ncbi:GNAT family N-acetyltransferase [Segetibacter koreensis]|uniref:GNAT family N-acetyltransferase n=1 Tax=Segetibacter koreensis TaxID=398037 RepID=UPI000367B3AE|nr:GNAT family N-acetyltransferase [Segetibacter koreensis]
MLSETALGVYSDHYLHLWHDQGKWYTDKYFSIERLTSELINPNSAFYLAFYNEFVAGFLKINLHAPLDNNKNALELERIYLAKNFEGKGIGKTLIQLTFAIAKESNKDLIWLKAMDSSVGPIAFYKKMGFEISGIYELKHVLMKEELRGMVIMTKKM